MTETDQETHRLTRTSAATHVQYVQLQSILAFVERVNFPLPCLFKCPFILILSSLHRVSLYLSPIATKPEKRHRLLQRRIRIQFLAVPPPSLYGIRAHFHTRTYTSRT